MYRSAARRTTRSANRYKYRAKPFKQNLTSQAIDGATREEFNKLLALPSPSLADITRVSELLIGNNELLNDVRLTRWIASNRAAIIVWNRSNKA